jgi:hypothetical protein
MGPKKGEVSRPKINIQGEGDDFLGVADFSRKSRVKSEKK